MTVSHEPRDALEVTIRFGAGSDPVAGWLRGPDGAARDFTGWLELNSLLLGLVAQVPGGEKPGGRGDGGRGAGAWGDR